ncbi:terpene synthase family protein [Streptomyces sparsus]
MLLGASVDMSAKRYTELLTDFLGEVEYHDLEVPSEDRMQALCDVFQETMEHFTGQIDIRGVPFDHEWLTCIVRTITRMTVFGWGNLPRDAMVPLNIYFTYVILEDDPREGPALADSPLMGSFACDLLRGREQAHPRFRSLFSFFPRLLGHYGPYAQLTMIKSNLELTQGFWIESRKFKGLPGASDYPMFLRRLNGLGDFSGAALFPAADFDEQKQFEDIVTVIAQIEPVVALVNDLFSFYKEIDDPEGDISLVENICTTEGACLETALQRIADDAARATRKLLGVAQDCRSATVWGTVQDFVRGYIRWHLCDERYRMRELVPHSVKFQAFQNMACDAGCIDGVDFAALSRLKMPR